MKVLIIVANKYNGHELWTALGIIQQAGIEFEIVSTDYIVRDEITLQPHEIRLTLNDSFSLAPFSGFMIVSGNMKDTEAYWTDKRVETIIRWFDQKQYPIAAICCSVPTIAPFAEGKKVSFYPLIRSRERLTKFGAILNDTTVTMDGNLVTAEHQMATNIWAETFVKMLKGDPEADPKLIPSIFKRKLNDRKPIKEIEALKQQQNGQP